MFESMVAGWVAIISVSYIPLSPSDIQSVASPLSLAHALQSFFLIALLTLSHRDRGPLVDACIAQEFHEPWTQGHVLLIICSHHCIIAFHLISLFVLFIISSLPHLLFVSRHLLSPRGVIFLSSLHGGQSCHFHYLSYGRWSRDPQFEKVTSSEIVHVTLTFESMLSFFDVIFGDFLVAFRACTIHLYVVKKKNGKRNKKQVCIVIHH